MPELFEICSGSDLGIDEGDGSFIRNACTPWFVVSMTDLSAFRRDSLRCLWVVAWTRKAKLEPQRAEEGEFTDLEGLDLTSKLDLLRKNEQWKCQVKREALEVSACSSFVSVRSWRSEERMRVEAAHRGPRR